MSDNTTPPVYTAELTSATWNDPPPPYTFPASFAIGTKTSVGPLVTVDQVKGHLTLLRAFAALRTQVEASDNDPLPVIANETLGERRWARFIALAVERFERWCKTVQNTDLQMFLENDLPPLDVLMVWHSYLLNPGWHAEDVARVPELQPLGKLNKFFAVSMSTIGKIATAEPSLRRTESWASKTHTPFDPLDLNFKLQKELTCPQCNVKLSVPFINKDGTGYSQQLKFTCTNSSCTFTITKSALGIAKFAKDLIRNDRTLYCHLAGTLFTALSPADTARAISVKTLILKHPTFACPTGASDRVWERRIRDNVKGDLNQAIRSTELKTMLAGERVTTRIVNAYMDGRVFSIDLVGAVLRQSSFVKKMHDLGWTEPSFFESREDEVALQHAVARYHAFLDLMSSSPASFLVPTLDIDLVWHTHQLMADKYKSDCDRYVGRFVDHDDKVEENQLSTAFDFTCRAWEVRHRVEYTFCGCPLPGETIGQKLSRFVNIHRQRFPRPPDRQIALAATHPSEHNSVYAFHHKRESEEARRRREEKVKKRNQRDLDRLSGGKADGLALQQQRDAHAPAFLLPVPIYYSAPINDGCVSYSGNVIDGANGGGCVTDRRGVACGSGACSGDALCGAHSHSGAGSESACGFAGGCGSCGGH